MVARESLAHVPGCWPLDRAGGRYPRPHAKAAFDRAEKALAGNQLDAAAAQLQGGDHCHLGLCPAINGLGSVYSTRGKGGRGDRPVPRGDQADPTFKLAYFNLGYAARKTSDFATAAGAYEKYTQLDPDDPDGPLRARRELPPAGPDQKAIAAYEGFLARRSARRAEVDGPREGDHRPLKAEVAPAEPRRPRGERGAPAPPSRRAPPPLRTPPRLRPGGAARKIAKATTMTRTSATGRPRSLSGRHQRRAEQHRGALQAGQHLRGPRVLRPGDRALDRVSQLSTDPAIEERAGQHHQGPDEDGPGRGRLPPVARQLPGTGPVADSTRERRAPAYKQGSKESTCAITGRAAPTSQRDSSSSATWRWRTSPGAASRLG